MAVAVHEHVFGARGEPPWVDDGVAHGVPERSSANPRGAQGRSSGLTPREWEVLDLLDRGGSSAGIADQLGLSQETVRGHVKSILRKLDVHSRGEAVAKIGTLRA